MSLEIKNKLSGVFAPIVTPFDEKGEIVFDALQRNITKLNETPLRGYFVLGTNGEFRSLTFEEKLKIVELVKKEASGKGKIVIAGASCESTFESIKLAKELCSLDVDFISLMPPSFFAKRMTDEMLVGYFTEVAEAIDKPVLLYNNPSVANGLCLSTKVITKVSEHPNIFGVKDTSKGNYDSYLLSTQGKDFWVLAGSASFFFPAVVLGGVGGVLSLANVFPDLCCQLYELAVKRDLEAGISLHRKIMKLNSLVSGSFGVAGVKAAMDKFGFEGLYPRRPLLPLSKEEADNLQEAIQKVL
ncbi:dihydrodipicolinate synthase family protein [Atrimonas thermophila]|uniref:dihydrodipicolinate synthase family protein n=1 Tax=Atrimonas thermophila TaxID=3064161 RepID=UPI00399CCDC4